jgi:putative membrane-bound dehydrogenase-like protein
MTRIPYYLLALCLPLLSTRGPDIQAADKFPVIVNSQNPRDIPPTPLEALRKITVPPGFRVTLFAGEPDVQQPIGMTLDDRGRLWVAECYTYAGGGNWDGKHRDRIVVFEDTDGDGRFDKRTVFWDQGRNLSSVAVGFGGVWALCAPNLLFIPDPKGTGLPAGPPQVVLDGWATKVIGHNIVNGLMWGPDGWLYGRHGIQETSRIGRPGTPDAQRTPLNCAIWRYHPTRKVFEVVAHGTTNPWGLDYDDHGQFFFTNNVNGHLWHLIPGAHYKRMYGEDLDPHVYDLVDQHADHYHWDAGKPWHESRDARGENGKRGGGHSHAGGMIYLGDNFPDAYRNTIFMCNTHGRRVNNDRLVRQGSGYIATHGEDFLFANDPWFRGLELRYGPDGGVYISDWTDIGECHDHDGVHRTSGRIYKVTYGQPRSPQLGDVSHMTDEELVVLQSHRNDYFVRAARRNLQERAAAGRDMKAVHAALFRMFNEQQAVPHKLRALWALYTTGGTSETWLRRQLTHESEHVRFWAVKLLVDRGPPGTEVLGQFVQLARDDHSGLVRLALASALQRLPVNCRGDLAAALLAHGEDAGDHNLPLMLWYGVEPLAAADPGRAVELAKDTRIPLVRRFFARRLTEDMEKTPEPLNRLLAVAASQPAEFQRDVVGGMAEGMRGWRKARPPEAWTAFAASARRSIIQEVRRQVRDLGVVFGDGRALAELLRIAGDGGADGPSRRAALAVLIDNRVPDLLPLLRRLVSDRATAALAMRGLGILDSPDTPRLVLDHLQLLDSNQRPEAINTLAGRKEYARVLLKAVADGRVPRGDISAFHARQIHSLGDKELDRELTRVWGELRNTPAGLKLQIAQQKQRLTPERLKQADLSSGRLLYNKTCASCHVLYGEGTQIGPDLTGSGRHDLDYLLENIIDPSAVVPADFRMSVVALKSGRVLTGLVGPMSGRTVTVQTQTEKVVLERSEIETIQPTQQSLMPDGLLTPLGDEQVRDLIAYLMTQEQVPLSTVPERR